MDKVRNPPSEHQNLDFIDSKSFSKTPLLLGLIFLTTSIIMIFLIPCPTSSQEFLFRLLLALGTGGIATIFPGIVILNIGGIKAGNIIGVFMLVYLINPGKFVSTNISNDKCNFQFTSLSISVCGKGGQQDMILRQKGNVIMDIVESGNTQSDRISKPIDSNGQALFLNAPIGAKVKLNIDFSEPYKSIYPDSLYIIQPNSTIYLYARLQGIDKVKGKVIYNDFPLSDVRVQIDTLSTTTDKYGNFSFTIPESIQKKEYKVWFTKTGFKTKWAPAFPEAGDALEIIMEKNRLFKTVQ